MNFLTELLELLPPPYTVDERSVVGQLLNVFALEMEALQEDTEAMRQTHWIETASRIRDLEKLAQLVGIKRLEWENTRTFRARLIAVVTARLRGALGPEEIKEFVSDYLKRAEDSFSRKNDASSKVVFVLGLDKVDDPFAQPKAGSRFRPLALVENPKKVRFSKQLMAVSGRVPYLYRWKEKNLGLTETVATFEIRGLSGGRTAAPVLVNLTTGELIGYDGTVALGQTLMIEQSGKEDDSRQAKATLNEMDVTASLFSVSKFIPGVPFKKEDFDAQPRLPRMVRGPNQWTFLSVGKFDLKGLNHFHFAIADDQLREGVFNKTFFDHALFPAGPVANLAMQWIETEPASFQVRIPWSLIIEPSGQALMNGGSPHELVAEGLRISLQQLHAAGVLAEIHFDPFVEQQPQKVRVVLPWKVLDPEKGPAGQHDRISFGAHFGESGFGDSYFE